MDSLKKSIDNFKSEVVSKAPAEIREVMLRCTQDIRAKGAQLVGMSPELPTKAELTTKNNGIDIDILYDAGNAVSERFGLVFELPEALRPIYEQFGIDIPAYNGDNSFRLPVPANYIVEQDGVIRYAYVNADYTERMEPSDILARL